MEFQLFVGVDLSKKYLDASFKKGSLQGEETERFENNSSGFKRLLRFVRSKGCGPQESLICFEHTGIYGLPLACFLTENKVPFSVQSALQIKRSMGIQRGKNDKADARMIARYAYLHREGITLTQVPSKSLLNIKQLLGYRDRLVRAKVAIQVAAKEIDEFTPSGLLKSIAQDGKLHVRQLQLSIAKIDKQLKEILEGNPELRDTYQLVTSVTGIGLQIAAHLIVSTSSFTRFENWRKFSCYCGLAPFEHQSGSSIRGKTRTSSLGNQKLKALIGNGVASALQWDQELATYYQRKIAEGKHKMVVQNAIKNKLISRVFATVKRGTPYVPLYLHKQG